MKELLCYINGEWTLPQGQEMFDVINPATEEITTRLQMGDERDIDKAAKAARAAFKGFSSLSVSERLDLLENILTHYDKRKQDLADAITLEMGAPKAFAQSVQTDAGRGHIAKTIEILKDFKFEKSYKISLVKKCPIGVCGLVTPWNWPLAVVMTKVAPALAVGCTIVLKPSEYSPLSAQIIAEIMDEAKVPKGVFNLVYGKGEVAGHALTSHKEVDFISLTGSHRAGVDATISAASTIKRVVLELGGKGPNIILPSSEKFLKEKVEEGLMAVVQNSGQTCNAPTRMLVQKNTYATVKATLVEAAAKLKIGSPEENVDLGPVVNKVQYERIRAYIQSGMDDGATLVTGGLERPDNLLKGYYIKPTVFMDTKADMKIVQEEIFGPVLVVQTYDTIEEAIELANGTAYGLSGFVQGENFDEVKCVADEIDAGQIYLNDSGLILDDDNVPFGGFKQSGNGREHGASGFEEFLELKSYIGWYPQK